MTWWCEQPSRWAFVGSEGGASSGEGLRVGSAVVRPQVYLDLAAMGAQLKVNGPVGVAIEQVRPLARNDPPFTKQLDAFRSFHTTPNTHITYAATWYTLAIIGAILTRNNFAPGRGASAKRAIANSLLAQPKGPGAVRAVAVMLLVTL